MAKGTPVSGKACAKHPERPGAFQCPVCLRAFCLECMCEEDDLCFCSQECARKHVAGQARLDSLDGKLRKRQARHRMLYLIQLLVMVLILGGVVAGVYRWYMSHPEQLARVGRITDGMVNAISNWFPKEEAPPAPAPDVKPKK